MKTCILFLCVIVAGCGRTVTGPPPSYCMKRTDSIPSIATVTVTVTSAACKP